MQKWIIGLIAASALALTGCSSTCDNFGSTADELTEKLKPCLSSGDEPPTAFNVNQCDRSYENCTDAEKEALDEYIDCLNDLEACTPGTKDSFKNAWETCRDILNEKVGDNCQEIFEG